MKNTVLVDYAHDFWFVSSLFINLVWQSSLVFPCFIIQIKSRVRVTIMDFEKEIARAFNMDFKVELDDWSIKPDSIFDDIDLSCIPQQLVLDQSRARKACDEYFRVYADANPYWMTYNSIKALYLVTFVQLKLIELEILDQLYDKIKVAVGCAKHTDFYYPATVLWKTRKYLLNRIHMDALAHNMFGVMVEKPKEGKDINYYGASIACSMKLIIAAKPFIEKIKFEEIEYFLNLLEMSMEILMSITIKVCE